uniref:C2H2-type domain-containing protein n=1 Tax=Oxyrrhis marina TaxID=2969 RepID=A0A7S3UKE2_OXYMA
MVSQEDAKPHALSRVQRSVTRDPPKTIPCERCGQMFRTKLGLNAHLDCCEGYVRPKCRAATAQPSFHTAHKSASSMSSVFSDNSWDALPMGATFQSVCKGQEFVAVGTAYEPRVDVACFWCWH